MKISRLSISLMITIRASVIPPGIISRPIPVAGIRVSSVIIPPPLIVMAIMSLRGDRWSKRRRHRKRQHERQRKPNHYLLKSLAIHIPPSSEPSAIWKWNLREQKRHVSTPARFDPRSASVLKTEAKPVPGPTIITSVVVAAIRVPIIASIIRPVVGVVVSSPIISAISPIRLTRVATIAVAAIAVAAIAVTPILRHITICAALRVYRRGGRHSYRKREEAHQRYRNQNLLKSPVIHNSPFRAFRRLS
jgi:hypothetical protein